MWTLLASAWLYAELFLDGRPLYPWLEEAPRNASDLVLEFKVPPRFASVILGALTHEGYLSQVLQGYTGEDRSLLQRTYKRLPHGRELCDTEGPPYSAACFAAAANAVLSTGQVRCGACESFDAEAEHLAGSLPMLEASAQHHKHVLAKELANVLGSPQSRLAQNTRNYQITLVDLGAGPGEYSIEAARVNPTLHVIMIDGEAVCRVSTRRVAEAGLQQRITCLQGSVLHAQGLPRDKDAMLLSQIFHDYEDEECFGIAQRVFTALKPGGHIVLHEMVFAPLKNGPPRTFVEHKTMLTKELGCQVHAHTPVCTP